jgi:PRC-barrel domain
MSRFVRLAGAALGCWVTAAGLAYSQAPDRPERRQERVPTPVPAQERRTTQTQEVETRRAPETFRAKAVLGSKVSIQGDLVIGTVDDIIFTDDGYVDYLVVANEGKYVPVPWEAAKFNFQQRTAVVNITQERFREVPTYTAERLPNFYDPTYRTQIYGYYGVRPPPERHGILRRR